MVCHNLPGSTLTGDLCCNSPSFVFFVISPLATLHLKKALPPTPSTTHQTTEFSHTKSENIKSKVTQCCGIINVIQVFILFCHSCFKIIFYRFQDFTEKTQADYIYPQARGVFQAPLPQLRRELQGKRTFV